jgi:hypothetical protein
MVTDDDKPVKVAFEFHDRWEVGLTISDTGSFQQISFVNSINTIKVLIISQIKTNKNI